MQGHVSLFDLRIAANDALVDLMLEGKVYPFGEMITVAGAREALPAENERVVSERRLLSRLRAKANAGEIVAAMVVTTSSNKRELQIRIEAQDEAPVLLRHKIIQFVGGPDAGRPRVEAADARIFLAAPMDARRAETELVAPFSNALDIEFLDAVENDALESLETFGGLTPLTRMRHADGSIGVVDFISAEPIDLGFIIGGLRQHLAQRGATDFAVAYQDQESDNVAEGSFRILLETAQSDAFGAIASFVFKRQPRPAFTWRDGEKVFDERAAVRGKARIKSRMLVRMKGRLLE